MGWGSVAKGCREHSGTGEFGGGEGRTPRAKTRIIKWIRSEARGLKLVCVAYARSYIGGAPTHSHGQYESARVLIEALCTKYHATSLSTTRTVGVAAAAADVEFLCADRAVCCTC